MGWSGWQQTSFPFNVRPLALAAAAEDDLIRVIAREDRMPYEGDLYEGALFQGGGIGGHDNIGRPPDVGVNGAPALACITDRRDLFVNAGYQLWHRSNIGPHGWSGWENLGHTSPVPTGIGSAPAVCRSRDRMDVFAVSAAEPFNLLHLYYDDLHGFEGWESLGGRWYNGGEPFRQPAATSWGPFRLDVFAVGTDHGIHHQWTDDGGAHWSGWKYLGGSTHYGIAACSWGPGRIDLFHRGDDRAIYHKSFQQPPLGGGDPEMYWSGWESLGGLTDYPLAAATRRPGHLAVLHIGTDFKVYYAEFQ